MSQKAVQRPQLSEIAQAFFFAIILKFCVYIRPDYNCKVSKAWLTSGIMQNNRSGPTWRPVTPLHYSTSLCCPSDLILIRPTPTSRDKIICAAWDNNVLTVLSMKWTSHLSIDGIADFIVRACWGSSSQIHCLPGPDCPLLYKATGVFSSFSLILHC